MIFKHTSGVERSSSSLEQKIQNAINAPKDTKPSMIRKALNNFFDLMNDENYEELSLGVNLDNFIALNLYVKLGFDKIQLPKYLQLRCLQLLSGLFLQAVWIRFLRTSNRK